MSHSRILVKLILIENYTISKI